MKAKNILTCLIFNFFTVVSLFAFSVSKGTVVNIGKQTQIKLTNIDLQNDGSLIGDTTSLLIISATKERKISGQDFYLSSLKIAGDVVCEVPMLTLNGDLTMLSGVLNIGRNKLIVHGDLLNENEKTYVTASTGAIEKIIAHLSAGQQINVFGLEFSPLNDVFDVGISRSHTPVIRSTVSGNYNSANRVYSYSKQINITRIKQQALPHETTHISKQTLFVENHNGWQKVITPNDDYLNITQVAIFPPDELYFPKIITPNDATNNVFRIIGLEEYPNSRLIVLSKNGKILYDIYPYQNDFNGKDLANGTYYYIFSEEYNSPPIKKSFFEILKY